MFFMGERYHKKVEISETYLIKQAALGSNEKKSRNIE